MIKVGDTVKTTSRKRGVTFEWDGVVQSIQVVKDDDDKERTVARVSFPLRGTMTLPIESLHVVGAVGPNELLMVPPAPVSHESDTRDLIAKRIPLPKVPTRG